MAWKKGPLPAGTWMWGGVVPKGVIGGFLFADFCGDHVKTVPGDEIIKAEDVEWYDNSLELPPKCPVSGSRLPLACAAFLALLSAFLAGPVRADDSRARAAWAWSAVRQAPLPPQAPAAIAVTETRSQATLPIKFDRSYAAKCVCPGGLDCTCVTGAHCGCLSDQGCKCGTGRGCPCGGPQAATEPVLRQSIARYKASGGQRAYVVGEDLRTHLMREHRYTERQLSGLTQEELELLHGWIHADRERETRQRAPVQYQPRYFSAPSFGGFRGGSRGGC